MFIGNIELDCLVTPPYVDNIVESCLEGAGQKKSDKIEQRSVIITLSYLTCDFFFDFVSHYPAG